MQKEKLLISACLLGIACRYDGNSKTPPDSIEELSARYELIPICPEIYGGLPTPRTPSERIGDKVLMKDGTDVTIAATGFMVHVAVEAAEKLAREGINARVLNIHTVKPIDEEIIVKAAKETGAIVTAEEHNVIGGFGSAVCDVVTEKYPVPVLKVGVMDKFGKSGKVPALLEEYGLTSDAIVAKAKAAIALKK